MESNKRKVKVKIKKYDVTVTEAPFRFINLGEFEVMEDLDDVGGVKRYNLFNERLRSLDYRGMKFYTSADKNSGYDYEVVVPLTIEEYPYCTQGEFGCKCLTQFNDNLTKEINKIKKEVD